jgi:hypothetical protein
MKEKSVCVCVYPIYIKPIIVLGTFMYNSHSNTGLYILTFSSNHEKISVPLKPINIRVFPRRPSILKYIQVK